MTDSGGVQEASVTGNMDSREDAINDLLQARSEIDEELRRHKTKITVLFTDIVGSTQYFDRFGDTAGLLLLHRHDNCVSSAVAATIRKPANTPASVESAPAPAMMLQPTLALHGSSAMTDS